MMMEKRHNENKAGDIGKRDQRSRSYRTGWLEPKHWEREAFWGLSTSTLWREREKGRKECACENLCSCSCRNLRNCPSDDLHFPFKVGIKVTTEWEKWWLGRKYRQSCECLKCSLLERVNNSGSAADTFKFRSGFPEGTVNIIVSFYCNWVSSPPFISSPFLSPSSLLLLLPHFQLKKISRGLY